MYHKSNSKTKTKTHKGFLDNLGKGNLLEVSEKISNNTDSINRILNDEKPEYFSQFDVQTFDAEGHPNALNDTYKTNDKTKLADLERSLSYQGGWTQYRPEGSLTYGVTPDDQLSHDNMMPFFSTRYGYGSNDLQNTSAIDYKNELFTGNLKTWRDKEEVKPFFSPAASLTQAYGTPVPSDEERSRYNTSMYRQNEKLFDPVRVTPGLNLGYDENGNHGFHSMYRSLDKTIDELRIKPKVTYEGRIIEGMRGQGRAVQAPVVPHRPHVYKTTGKKDLLPTGSENKGPKAKENFIIKEPHKAGQLVEYTGGAFTSQESAGQNVPEYMRSKHKKSTRQNFTLPKPLHKFAGDKLKFNPNLSSHLTPVTLKDKVIHSDHMGQIGVSPAIYANSMNAPNNTIKETTLQPIQAFSNITPNTLRGTVHNMNPADTTMKELIANNPFSISAPYTGTAQRVYYPDQLSPTTKETLIDIPYHTMATPVNQQQRTPNLQDVLRTTSKEMTVQTPWNNFTTPINRNQGPTAPQDITKTTIKETTVSIPHNNFIMPINQTQGQTNHQDIAKTTLKETFPSTRNNLITPVNQYQGQVNLQDIPRTTVKETLPVSYKSMIRPINQQRAPNLPEGLKTTMKESLIETQHTYNPVPINQQRAPNITDNLRTTNKELTVQMPQQTMFTPINQQQRAPNVQELLKTTNKETIIEIPYHTNTTPINQYQGQANTFNRDPLRTTLKEQTSEIMRNMVTTAVGQQQRAPNLRDPLRATIKETTAELSRNTHLTPIGQQQRTPNYQEMLPTTTKESLIEIPYNTNLTGVNQSTGQASTYHRTPTKTTIKEMVIDNNRISAPVLDVNGKGYGYLAEKKDAPNTNRQFTVQKTFIAPLHGMNKPKPYDDAYRMETNDRKEQILKSRKPTSSSVTMGPDPDKIYIPYLKNDSQENTLLPMGYSFNNELDRMVSESYIKVPNVYPDTMFDNQLLVNQLEKNPYHLSINNGI